MHTRRQIHCLALLAVPVAGAALAQGEPDLIEALLVAMAARSELRFLRGGRLYTAAEAARFLRAKLASQGPGMKSAELFIQNIGSRSSSTGQIYRVVWPGGRQQAASEFLAQELARIDAAAAAGAAKQR